MKRPYNPPRLTTREVQFGVFGDYGTAGGPDTFDSGPSGTLRDYSGGQIAGS